MSYKLFEYAVIFQPTESEVEEGVKPELVVPVQSILAKSENEVQLRAARKIPSQYDSKLSQVEIAVRPF